MFCSCSLYLLILKRFVYPYHFIKFLLLFPPTFPGMLILWLFMGVYRLYRSGNPGICWVDGTNTLDLYRGNYSPACLCCCMGKWLIC